MVPVRCIIEAMIGLMLFVRLDPQDNPAGLEPGMTVWLNHQAALALAASNIEVAG